MKLIACVSKDMGIGFNNRRQSRDALLCQDVLQMTKDNILWIHPRSKILFEEASAIEVSEDYLDKANADDYCFYEAIGQINWEKVDQIILYRWNRAYPSDIFFRIPKGFQLIAKATFPGKSHPEITKEVWTR